MHHTCVKMFVFYVLFLTAVFGIVQTCHPRAAYYDQKELVSRTLPVSIPEEVSMTTEDVYLATSIITDVDYDLMVTTGPQQLVQTELAMQVMDEYDEERQEEKKISKENEEHAREDSRVHQCEPCSPRHLQNRFCHSDFVIQGRIAPHNFTGTNESLSSHLNNTHSHLNQTWYVEGDERNYKTHDNEISPILQIAKHNTSSSYLVISLERVLKGSHGLLHRHGLVEIFYDAAHARCHGKELQEHTSYIFMGSVTNGRLELQKCDWPLELSQLTGSQRHGLKQHYGRFCRHCKVDTQILPPDPWSTSSYSHVCVYNPTLYNQWGQEDCEGDYSACVKTNMGTCHWLKTTQMRACVERRDNDRGLGMPPAPAWIVPDPN